MLLLMVYPVIICFYLAVEEQESHSCVRALLPLYCEKGLRLIEMPKQSLRELPELIDTLKKENNILLYLWMIYLLKLGILNINI
nr:DUF815 domain-containing protein [endosymbiont 'TC1' of Trimyema compressum]